MAEHVMVENKKLPGGGQALVPLAALGHYEARGFTRVETEEAEVAAAAASVDRSVPPSELEAAAAEAVNYGSLDKATLLEQAKARGLEVDAKTTKSDLVALLESA